MIKRIKKAQEEMVGFALIVIIVAVILIVFLLFSLRSSQQEAVESYEVESFINALLQYTSDCAETYEPNYVKVQKLIFNCRDNEVCLDGRDACDALEFTLNGIIEESWPVGEGWPVLGYVLNITSDNDKMIELEKGEITNNYEGSAEYFTSEGVEIFFTAYY